MSVPQPRRHRETIPERDVILREERVTAAVAVETHVAAPIARGHLPRCRVGRIEWRTRERVRTPREPAVARSVLAPSRTRPVSTED